MGAEFLEGTSRFNNALRSKRGARWRLDDSVRSVCLCESLCLCGEFSRHFHHRDTENSPRGTEKSLTIQEPWAQTADAIGSR